MLINTTYTSNSISLTLKVNKDSVALTLGVCFALIESDTKAQIY